MSELYQVTKAEITKCAEIYADAFSKDPIWIKIFEGIADDWPKRCACFEMPVRHCMHYGQVRATSSELEGIIATVTGRYSNMGFWTTLKSGSIGAALRMGSAAGKRVSTALGPLGRDRAKHMQGKEYTYVQTLGVKSEHQGKGFGGRLLEAVLQENDQNKQPVYLETETEYNVKWYKKFGFKVLEQIELPLIKVPMWQMLRDSQ